MVHLQYFKHFNVFPEYVEELRGAVMAAISEGKTELFIVVRPELLPAMEAQSYSEIVLRMKTLAEQRLEEYDKSISDSQ